MLRLKQKLDKDHTLSCLDFQFCTVFPFIGYFTIVVFDWCAVIRFFVRSCHSYVLKLMLFQTLILIIGLLA